MKAVKFTLIFLIRKHKSVTYNSLRTIDRRNNEARKLKIASTGHNIITYIRILSGRPDELKSAANFLTDAIELRSNSITSIFAAGISLSIVSLTSIPVLTFLTAITTWTPRNARIRVVSKPRPLDAPEIELNNH